MIEKTIRVIYPIFNITILLITFTLIMNIHLEYALLLSFAIYGIMLCVEVFYLKVYSPITFSLIVIYALEYLVLVRGVDSNIALHVFSGLFISTFFYSIIKKKPFTMAYSEGLGLTKLHIVNSALWISGYLASSLICFFMGVNFFSIYLPLFICIAISLLTTFFSFFWFGTRSPYKPILQNSLCVEVSERKEDICNYLEQYVNRIVDSKFKKNILDLIYNFPADQIIIAKVNGKVVGGMSIFYEKGSNSDYPMDSKVAIGMTKELRKYGKTCYIGRLVVSENNGNINILYGMYQKAIDILIYKNIYFVLSESSQKTLMSYINMGFEFLFDKEDKNKCVVKSSDFGVIEYPLIFNLPKYALSGSTKYREGFLENIDIYSLEIWYKKMLIISAFKRFKPWEVDKKMLFLKSQEN